MPNLNHLNSALPGELQSAIPPAARRVLRVSETAALVGYCNMQLLRMEQAGLFPKRFKLNPEGGKNGAAGHDYGEVMAWIAERMASRDTEAAI